MGEKRGEQRRFRLGVHVLSEFVFCQRAGVITHALERSDSGEEDDEAPRLGYLPDYDARLIEESLADCWKRVWRFFFCCILGIIGVGGLGIFINAFVAFAAGVSGLVFVHWLIAELKDIARLAERWRLAEMAVAKEPNLDLSCPQEMDWWGLRKAGFELVRYEEPFRDDSLKDGELELVGKPRFVLLRGSLRIPVLGKKDDSPDLKPTHFSRLAAYCHLIRVCENAETPFGLVLLGNTYKVIAVPIDSKDQRNAVRLAEEAHRVILSARQRRYRTKKPKTESHCSGCPHGEPREFSEGESKTILYGISIPPFSPRGKYDDVYHSPCGDRFRWVPPHKFAEVVGRSD